MKMITLRRLIFATVLLCLMAQNTHMKQKTLQATVIQLFIIAKDQRQNHGFLKLLLLVQELLKIYPYIMTNNEN